MPQERHALQNWATEWSYTSVKPYDDPFNDVELDVIFTDPEGKEWRVRFVGQTPGVEYQATFHNPSTGEQHPVGKVVPNDKGIWPCARPPIYRDYVLIMERSN